MTVAGTVSPKQKRVRSKSRSSGERCMSDQSDTDMDTSVKSDHLQPATSTPMVVDKTHSDTADRMSTDGKSSMISLSFCCHFVSLFFQLIWHDAIS